MAKSSGKTRTSPSGYTFKGEATEGFLTSAEDRKLFIGLEKTVNDTFEMMHKSYDFSGVPDVKIKYIPTWKLPKEEREIGTAAWFDQGSKEIVITDYALYNKEKGRGDIIHEIAHSLNVQGRSMRRFGRIDEQRLEKNYRAYLRTGVRDYGTTNVQEFIAESVRKYHTGKTLHSSEEDTVKLFIEKYKKR